MSWKDKLQPSGIDFVQQIIDQIPTALGGRDAFEALLDKIADEGGAPKFRYVWLDEYGFWCGTNDKDAANEVSNDGETVLDVIEGKDLDSGEVRQYTEPVEGLGDEDEDPDNDA